MYIDSIRFNSAKLIYLKDMVTRVTFLRFIYIVACLIVSVMIENIKLKTMFNKETEINCMFKWLMNIA